MREKFDTFESFRNLCIKFKNEKNYNIDRIVRIKSNRGKEFENSIFFFATSIEFLSNFPPPRHHNKMMLLKGKIVRCRK